MSRDTKKRILETATQMIYLHGFNNTSLNDILVGSEISKGNFFYYFKNKDELGFAVLDKTSKEFFDRIDNLVLSSDKKPIDKVFDMLDMELSTFKEKGPTGGCPLGNLAAELSDNHEEFRSRILNVFERWTKIVQEMLDKARADGTFPPDTDTRSLAVFIISAVEGALILMKTKRDITPLEQTIRSVKRHINSLRKDSTAEMAGQSA